jgi:hypothetical protein
MMQDEEGALLKTSAVQENDYMQFANQFGLKVSKKNFFTVLVCVGVCMLFSRGGILSFFYLAPLGYAVMASGSFLFTFFTATIANIIFCAISASLSSGNINFWMDIFYLTTLFLAFTWFMGSNKIRTTYRIILASVAGSAVFLMVIFSSDSGFFTIFERIVYDISANIYNSSSSNGIGNSAMQGMFAPENMLNVLKTFLLRGGAVSSIIFLLFINRFIAISVYGIINRQKRKDGLIGFFAPHNAIWIFAGALASVLVSNIIRIEIFEILAWNVFVVCGIVFLAQGVGILIYWLSNVAPGLRFAFTVLIIMILFSPVSTIALTAVLLLGIMECWLPLRQQKGPVSTPKP